jgi:hypothetical protein
VERSLAYSLREAMLDESLQVFPAYVAEASQVRQTSHVCEVAERLDCSPARLAREVGSADQVI